MGALEKDVNRSGRLTPRSRGFDDTTKPTYLDFWSSEQRAVRDKRNFTLDILEKWGKTKKSHRAFCFNFFITCLKNIVPNSEDAITERTESYYLRSIHTK